MISPTSPRCKRLDKAIYRVPIKGLAYLDAIGLDSDEAGAPCQRSCEMATGQTDVCSLDDILKAFFVAVTCFV
jgi:hypothetical protein